MIRLNTTDGHLKFMKVRQAKPIKRLAAFDCEGDIHAFRVACLWTASGPEMLYSREDAWARLEELAGTVEGVWCHNLGYDLAVLFPQPWPAELKIQLVGERVSRATWRGLTFYDSMGLDSRRISDIGLALHLPKLDRPKSGDMVDWAMYCRRDAEIVYELLMALRLWAELRGISFLPRIGTMAIHAWLASVGGRGERIPCAEPSDDRWGRAAMYPGRAEVYQEGECDHVWTYDINSHYADCLRGEFPDPRTGFRSGVRRALPGFERVRVTVPAGVPRPVLPYRATSGQVFYPTGMWTATFTTEELVEAELSGAAIVEHFEGGYYYSRMLTPFRDFVDEVYALRLQAEDEDAPLTAYACKRILNALWGRLGLQTGNLSEIIRASEWDGLPCGTCRNCKSGRLCWRLVGAKRAGPYWVRRVYAGRAPDYVNAAWAAWVLSAARLKLLKWMDTNRAANVIRVHTDSLTLDRPALAPYVGRRIGAVKLEYDGPYNVRGVNAYQDNRAHVAGVPRENMDEFWTTGTTTIRRARGLLEGLVSEDAGRWVEMAVSLQASRPSRADGGRRPWTVQECEGFTDA
jgi:DNA polymerase type B, organellar and viral